MRRRLALLMTLALAACGNARWAADARGWAVGRKVGDLEACIGLPDQVGSTPDGSTIYEWHSADPVQQLGDVPLALVGLAANRATGVALPAAAVAGSLPLTIGGGDCRAMAVARDGVVTKLDYAGAGDGLSGRDALCGQELVRNCVREGGDGR